MKLNPSTGRLNERILLLLQGALRTEFVIFLIYREGSVNRLTSLLFSIFFLSASLLFAADPDAPDPREEAPEKPLVEENFTPPMVKSAAGPDKAFLDKMHGKTPEKKVKKEDLPLIDLKVGSTSGMGSVSTTPEAEMMFVNKKYKLRAEPYSSCKEKITTVFPTYHVKVLYIVDDHGGSHGGSKFWIKVQTRDGRAGFIPKKYLQKDRPLIVFAPPSPSTIEAKKMYVNASSLYLRSGPDTNSYAYTRMPQKSVVYLIRYGDRDAYIDGRVGKWAYVEYKSPRYSYSYKGWVFSPYLSSSPSQREESSNPENPNHIFSGSTKYIKSKILHIRDEPSKFGTVIATFPHGTSVSITERRKERITIMGIKSVWVKISTGTVTGWVYGGFLSSRRGYFLANDFIDRPLRYPLASGKGWVSSPYGLRVHPISKRSHMHTGIDFATPRGTPIFAAGNGRIKMIKNYGRAGYGKLVVIEHPSGLYTYYAHQNSVRVRQGQTVKSGDIIGTVGSTGASTGPHLHFEVRTGYWKGTRNPVKYIPLNTSR